MNKYIKIIIYILIVVVLAICAFYLYKHISTKIGASASKKALSSKAIALFASVDTLEKQGDFIRAKQICQDFLYEHPDSENTQQLQNKIASLNIGILFSSIPTQDSQTYEVAPGDSLEKIAKKFGTTVELIKKANNLSGVIRPGMRLKVQNKPFVITIDKSQNILTLISGKEVIKVYTVSTGKNNSTPTGTFKIVNKLIDTPWYSAKGVIPPESPEYVLGSRWMGIDRPGYGIHGTNDPGSIGSQCTEGCVRMYNPDVEELYTIVPQGTEVTIID